MATQVGKGRLELIEVLSVAGTSAPQAVPDECGVTVTAATGTALLQQTSDAIESVMSGSASWETWSPGTATVGAAKHGIVYGATAVRLVSTGVAHYHLVEG